MLVVTIERGELVSSLGRTLEFLFAVSQLYIWDLKINEARTPETKQHY